MPNGDKSLRSGLKMDPSIVGDSGLARTGGFITDEFLPDLHGAKGLKIYKEMSTNDPVCGAILFAIKTLIGNCEFSVQACDDSDDAEEAKTFVEEILDDMTVPLGVVLSEICTMFEYGFAPMEIIWKWRGGLETDDATRKSKYDDGKIGVRNISLRGQSTIIRWALDTEDGSIDGFWQQPPSGVSAFLPIEKLLLFRTTEDRQNPEGRSILRNAYRPWYYKKRMEELEAVGVERDLAGIPVLQVPSSMMRADADVQDKAIYSNYQQMLRRLRQDQQTGVVLPSDRDKNGNLMFELSLLSASGSRNFDTTKIIDRYDRRIAMVVLADFIFLGQAAVGSFALSSNKTEMFASAVGSYTKAIAAVFNRYLLPRVWQLNGLDPEMMPSIVPQDLEGQDLQMLAAFVDSLAKAGMPLFPDRELENHFRKLADFPPAPEEGEDMRTPYPPGTDPNDPYAENPDNPAGPPADSTDDKKPAISKVKKKQGGKK